MAPVRKVTPPTANGIQESHQDGDEGVDAAKASGRVNDRTPDSSSSVILQTLTDDERKIVEYLKARDREVRVHEQAHLSAAGSVAIGGPSFSFQTGPDGRRYAVGGEVAIDTSSVAGNPQATIEKANRIQRAAMAPAEPSAADRQVAAQAAAMKREAQTALLEQRVDEAENGQRPSDDFSFRKNGEGIAESVEKPEADCEICGGSHSASSHSDSTRQKIEAVFAINGAGALRRAVTLDVSA